MVAAYRAGGSTGGGEAETVYDTVETALENLQHDFTGNTTLGGGTGIDGAELLLHQTVEETDLLLFGQGESIVSGLAAPTLGTMLTGAVRAALQVFIGTKERRAETAT